ncbi:MAG: eukaryotic-like serine/threonine-protein kinase [Thermoanaerobaculia bacterium]|jgi:serine/threonine protein kinase|nr:eukaryotic-like serine/threonine-protein kinase [Thermoanaerobaculia bacterium]
MLAAGTMLGPYKILTAIGAGGMGEVYRAQDTRLGRDVAVKVLTRNLSGDAEALRRFEQEARAAGILNHPNILAIYDIGSEEGQNYIVSELLEGESLRARIRQGAIPPRKVLDYAAQIARGLSAAHERNIVHRDLKPENLFITRDGHVKILDFGLAKLTGPRLPNATPGDEHELTLPTTPTEPGRLMGTIGYMAPEQVRGGSGDNRSDIFAFGVIVYEMLAGVQPFRAESPIETLNAILKDDPPDFFELNIRVPGALDRVVRHCLEKNPDERFQSARDLAFDLGSLSGLTSQAVPFLPMWHIRPRRFLKPLAIGAAILALAAIAFFLGQRRGTQPPPSYHRLTFRSGTIFNARFSPDGQTVFYGARWGGNPMSIFSVRADSPESRDLDLGAATDILSVSRGGQLAISLRRHPIGYLRESGTLAQVPIAGGAPREILEDVEYADWSPDGRLAVVRTIGGRCRLEFPIGNVVYDTVGWISHPRFSPGGEVIAVLDHPFFNDDRGSVVLVSLATRARRALTKESVSIEGLAWTASGGEIVFSSEEGANARAIRAVNLHGKSRLLAASAGPLWFHDIAPDGRILVTREIVRAGIVGIRGNSAPIDLSWFDYSVVRDLSADGKTIVFSESGEAGGALFGVYTRGIDGSPAIRLGDGTSEALSPDGEWVLSIPRNRTPAQIVMLPTGTGQPRQITKDHINHRNARWMPDGKQIFFQGNEERKAPRIWIQSLDGSAPRAITPENVRATQATPDGRYILGGTSDRKFNLYPVAGGAVVPVPALKSGDVPTRFTPDGRSLFVATFGKIPAMFYKIDLASGTRTLWREAMPADPSGLINVGPILVTPDGATTVYSYTRLLSDLYVIGR